MKKLLMIMVVVLMTLNVKAQSAVAASDGTYPVYCDLVAYNFWGVGKVKVKLDMGEFSDSYQFESLYDTSGKKIKFNTVMGAVNYMAKHGWKLDKTYYATEGSMAKQDVMHYVLVKYVKEEGEIREGITTKPAD